MIHKVKIPQLDVNDDTVIFSEWYVKEGDQVNADTPLCLVETSKATVVLSAEVAGYVKSLRYEVGDEISLQEIICYIVDSIDTKIPPDMAKSKAKASQGSPIFKVSATAKAQKLAEELGVNLSEVSQKGVIREKDVLSFYRLKNIKNESSALPIIKGTSKDFKNSSSEDKILFYRSKGAHIGNNVSIGLGSVIVAKNIYLADDVAIGEDTYIEADELKLGEMVQIGRNCQLVSGTIDIGDVTTITDYVIFDLSGGKSHLSQVIIGSRCLLAKEVYLNASRTIDIGDYVALSPRAIVYTHSFWQSVLDGYHANFGNVIIKENSWIGSAAQLLPGVEVGQGSIVMSNSLVTSHVLPYSMVGGVPAVVIKNQVRREVSMNSQKKILASLMEEFINFLKYKGVKTKCLKDGEKIEYTIDSAKLDRKYRLVLVKTENEVSFEDREAIYIGLNFKHIDKQVSIFDVGRKQIFGPQNIVTAEIRNFLRRRGIVFSPIYWRYDYKKGL